VVPNPYVGSGFDSSAGSHFDLLGGKLKTIVASETKTYKPVILCVVIPLYSGISKPLCSPKCSMAGPVFLWLQAGWWRLLWQ